MADTKPVADMKPPVAPAPAAKPPVAPVAKPPVAKPVVAKPVSTAPKSRAEAVSQMDAKRAMIKLHEDAIKSNKAQLDVLIGVHNRLPKE